MLDGSSVHNGEANIGNVENNNPITGNDGLNTGNKGRQAVLKKGGKKLRPLHNQKPPRNSLNIRLTDNNNNSLTASSAAQPGTELPAGTETVLNLRHLKQGARKELLKSKGGRSERGASQPGVQPARGLVGHEHQISQNVNVRSPKQQTSQSTGTVAPKKPPPSSSSFHQPVLREQQKKPLHASNNLKIFNAQQLALLAAPEYLKDGEKVYAGAKFSEPPSPSVLPKPPSHWVGENEPHQQQQQSNNHQSREQMTVHLKSLLKVQDKA